MKFHNFSFLIHLIALFMLATLSACSSGGNGGAVNLPGQANLLTPSGTVTGSSPLFSWNELTKALSYTLQVKSLDSDQNIALGTYPLAEILCSEGVCSLPLELELPEGSYMWRLRAENQNGQGTWSDSMNFEMGLRRHPNLLTPSGAITDSSPLFSWNELTKALSYTLHVKSLDSDQIIALATYPLAEILCGEGVCSLSLELELLEGAYMWRLRAENQNGQGPWSDSMNFEVGPRRHPFVFWQESDIMAAFDNATSGNAEQAWRKEILDDILDEAQSWLDKDVDVPHEGGGYTHYYVDPDTGAWLIYDPNEPYRHESTSGAFFTGKQYDAAWRSLRHIELGEAVKTLGLAYLLETDVPRKMAYAAQARQIILSYTEKYLSFPFHDRYDGVHPSGGRVSAQTLEEAIWLINIVAGYDSIYDSGVLSDAEKAAIETDLIREATEVILGYDTGLINWQVWHNTAIGAVGFLLDDQSLVSKALYGESGFQAHMQQAVMDDGLWHEGTFNYHFFVLQGYIQLSEAALLSGIDLYQNPRYRLMFEAPLGSVMPDLKFPKLSDVQKDNKLRLMTFEIANTRWNSPVINWFLKSIYDSGTPRSDLTAFIYGSPLYDEGSFELESINFEPSGLGILRAGASEKQIYLLMRYGAHGRSHGHLDKLGIILYKNRELLPDMGTSLYTLPERVLWYTQTLSHNTLMMEEQSQLASNESTPIDYFEPSGGDFQVIQANMGAQVCSTGKSATRTLVMVRDQYVVDVVTARGGTGPYDLVFHHEADEFRTNGDLIFTDVSMELASRWAASKAGHSYLRPPEIDGTEYQQIQQAVTSDGWNTIFSKNGNQTKLNFYVAGYAETTVLAAKAPSNPKTEDHPVIILRRNGGESTRFVTLWEPFEIGPLVSSVKVEGNQIVVQYGPETHLIIVDQDRHLYSLDVQPPP